MITEPLSAALEREHREIDAVIEVFVDKLAEGSVQREPLVDALEALRRHIYIEEAFLFPPIRAAGLVMPIFVMLREHGELWHTMQTLIELLDAEADRERLLEVSRNLLAQLDQHNSKEEPIVYPRVDIDVPTDTHAELTRFMETGHTPQGWVCQQADLSGAQ